MLLLLVGMLAGTAQGQDLTMKTARIVLSASDASDARLVGTVSNASMYSTYLVSATTDAAERLEFRDARKRDAKVAEVEVPAYGDLSLELKGIYVRFLNPKKPLKAGDRIVVTFLNETKTPIRVTAVVGR